MLSRVANSVYWMGRYIERAENVARFIHVNFNLLLDCPTLSDERQWTPIIEALGDWPNFQNRYQETTEENVIQFLNFDTENPNSIISCLFAARENGRVARDILPKELWECLNNFYLMVRSRSIQREQWDIHGFYNEVKKASHLFIGISTAIMCREEAFRFAVMGKLLERADQTSRIMAMRNPIELSHNGETGTSLESTFLGAILKSASAFEIYQKHFHQIDPKKVMGLLIFDKTFPRSLQYCVEGVKTLIKEDGPLPEEANHLAQLEGKDIESIFKKSIPSFVHQFQGDLARLGDCIHRSFFTGRSL